MEQTISWLITGPFMYVSVAVFMGMTIKFLFDVFNMPRHLRWDLYPVPHDGPEGSKFQRVDYWKEDSKHYTSHMIFEMAEEIMLLKRTFQHNRKLWNFSYPMHIGLYMGIAWLAMLFVGAVIQITTDIKISAMSTVWWGQALMAITVVTGVIGLVAGTIGTLGLIWIRHTDENLSDFSSPITFFNLYLLLSIFAVGLLSWFKTDIDFAIARNYVESLILFKPITLNGLMTVEVFLVAFFIFYLPFSRMFHFGAKYFFYHNIMWDDEQVKKGSALEKDISGYLVDYKMTWSASHIKENGTWLEQATTNPTKMEVKKDEK